MSSHPFHLWFDDKECSPEIESSDSMIRNGAISSFIYPIILIAYHDSTTTFFHYKWNWYCFSDKHFDGDNSAIDFDHESPNKDACFDTELSLN